VGLVEVHQLIHEDDQAAVTRAMEEEGEELEVVVPVVVRDGHVHTQIGARLGLVGVFAAEPVQHLPLQLVVTLGKGTIVKAEQTGKVEAVHQVVHRAHHSEDLLLLQALLQGELALLIKHFVLLFLSSHSHAGISTLLIQVAGYSKRAGP